MSRETQIKFEKLVTLYHQRYNDVLNLTDPTFKEDGFVTRAIMLGAGGRVETLCGPPEYHAEIYIFNPNDQKRWDLAGLMGIKGVRDWIVSYSQKASACGKSPLEKDVEWIFLILAYGLKGIDKFDWLLRSSCK